MQEQLSLFGNGGKKKDSFQEKVKDAFLLLVSDAYHKEIYFTPSDFDLITILCKQEDNDQRAVWIKFHLGYDVASDKSEDLIEILAKYDEILGSPQVDELDKNAIKSAVRSIYKSKRPHRTYPDIFKVAAILREDEEKTTNSL